MSALQRGKGKVFVREHRKQPFHVLIRCQWNKVGRKLYRTMGLFGIVRLSKPFYIFHNPAGFCFNPAVMQGGDM